MSRVEPRLTRRDFIALGTGTLVLLSAPWASARRRRRIVRRTVPSMGSFAEIAIVSEDRRSADRAIDAAVREIRAVEDRLTRFRPDSDVGRVNAAPPGAAVPVSLETSSALEEARAWATRAAGRFDPCLGRAVELWHFGSRRTPPGDEAVQGLAGGGLYRSLEIDRRGADAVVRLHDARARIDLGGIGKGIGVDRAVAVLGEIGVRDALVNLGGDLYAMGRSENGDPWEIGIRSPLDPTRVATAIRLQDEAVATSGDYVRFFEHAGRRYHHLIDPRTGAPRRSAWHSLTVTASTCVAADAAATALFGTDPARARSLLSRWEPGGRVVTV